MDANLRSERLELARYAFKESKLAENIFNELFADYTFAHKGYHEKEHQ